MVEHINFLFMADWPLYIFFFDVWHVKWTNPVFIVRGFIKKNMVTQTMRFHPYTGRGRGAPR